MIKPIETVYNGYRFRSRLEARWAVFFDTLGIKYEYEKEGFELTYFGPPHNGIVRENIIRYLPDFWLPDLDVWVEIKGQKPTTDWSLEQEKAWCLAKMSKKPVAIFWGQIDIPASVDVYSMCSCCEALEGTSSSLAECPQCHAIGFIREINGLESLPCNCWSGTNEVAHIDHEYRHKLLGIMNEAVKTPRLIEAYTAARQARFEHGEKP